MGILSPVVKALVTAMLGVRKHRSNRRRVTGEFVSDYDARLDTKAVNYLA
jgi:hypothetical protein